MQVRILSRIALTVLGVGCLWVTGLTDDLFALRARHQRASGPRVSRANPLDDHLHDFDLILADCPNRLIAQHGHHSVSAELPLALLPRVEFAPSDEVTAVPLAPVSIVLRHAAGSRAPPFPTA